MPNPDTFRTPDAETRTLVRALIDGASEAALATLRPETGTPSISRIAIAAAPDGSPMSLVSSLAHQTAALEANPACALLIEAPAGKGDAISQTRVTLHCTARLIANDAPERAALRAHFLAQRPLHARKNAKKTPPRPPPFDLPQRPIAVNRASFACVFREWPFQGTTSSGNRFRVIPQKGRRICVVSSLF